MGRIAKKAITMIIACMMIVYMSLPVMASHEHSYLTRGFMNKSWLTDHLNGTCTISQLYWIIQDECKLCDHVVLISKEYRGEVHSKTHP